MSNDVPSGRRFSHVYLTRGEPVQDSTRMRRRLASLVVSLNGFDGLGASLEKELGVRLDHTMVGPDWDDFFTTCTLSDLLDTVTLAWRYLQQKGRRERYSTAANDAHTWLGEVNRIFAEENVRYKADAQGGVHFCIDEEFEKNRAAGITALTSQRYANALDQFESAHTHLTAVPPDGKSAIRAIFGAAECLFRLMFHEAPRLGAKEINKYLGPQIQRTNSDRTASRATSKLVSCFEEWVDAAHFYRHEPGEQEITQPPLPLAINLVSLGASYVRWLAEIDHENQK